MQVRQLPKWPPLVGPYSRSERLAVAELAILTEVSRQRAHDNTEHLRLTIRLGDQELHGILQLDESQLTKLEWLLNANLGRTLDDLGSLELP